MGKDLYTLKLKNLSEQISLMLMEAEGDVANEASSSLERMQSYLSANDPENAKNQLRVSWLKLSGIYQKVEDAIVEKANTPTDAENIAAEDALNAGIKAAILSITAVAVATVGALNIFAKGLDDVKQMTDMALGSSNYQDFSKHVNALKKIVSDTSLWSKLTVSSAAKEAAGSNVAMIKKGYIMAGVAMILVSLILVILAGVKLDVVGSIKEALKSLDIRNIMASVGKMVAIGVLALPAVIGAMLIVIAVGGFKESDMASKVASACYPVLKVVNIIVAKVIEVSQNAARNKVSSIKKMKALKK